MRLGTPRLVLREFALDDVDRMHAWQSDSRYLDHYPWDRTWRHEAKSLVELFCRWQSEVPRWRWQWAIELQNSGLLVGSAGVRRIDPGSTAADVGYELDPDYWGNGYATEAMRRVVTFGFDDLGLEDLSARVVRGNHRSVRVLERLGFTHAKDIPPGIGKDDRIWPERAEFRLRARDFGRK
jgi:RimJ/RimL family protein N-acetyltransferase